MVDLKDYQVEDDFKQHKFEFERTYEIIFRHTSLDGKTVLDLCSGTGMHTGFLLQRNPAYLIGVDLLDYETLWGGNFKQKLSRIYTRFDLSFDGNRCQFIRMNAQNLLFRDELFDFVYCLNAFEHISDPVTALLEIWRVLKPGGYAFIQFDPLFYCDTGGHMFDFVPEPWGHLVYAEDEYIEKLRQAGCPSDIVSDFRVGLNKRKKDYFLSLFRLTTEGETQLFKKIESYTWSGAVNPEHLSHENYRKLIRVYSREDLLFRGMNIFLQKI